MSKSKCKALVQESMKQKAFKNVIRKKESRNSENGKGKVLKYDKIKYVWLII